MRTTVLESNNNNNIKNHHHTHYNVSQQHEKNLVGWMFVVGTVGVIIERM